ncbi:MAG: cytochrome c biogenesis protein ResB, partial [Desulfohalobiaceae bacterium]|nr:cytochrome c biogenesis protein ResB [Desulfohalobiaceae bacterium]
MKKTNTLWNILASVKLTLFLLLTLAATSIFGTLIPQQDNAAAAIRHYGETLYRILHFFDLFDMYHSWWFQVLLLLLAANLVVCSIERLSSTWKIFFAREPGFKPERFQKQPNTQEFTLQRPAEEVAESFRRTLGKRFRTVREEQHDQELYFFVEQYRWSRLGVYVVHLSVLLMLIGGLLGSLFGFQGFATIVEGESTSEVRLRGSDRSLALDFAIKCEDFEVSFYDSGAPKEFRSDLVLLQDGRAVREKSIVVNDPLRYQGISIYQASYGRLPPQESQGAPESVTLRIEHKATGKTQTLTTGM